MLLLLLLALLQLAPLPETKPKKLPPAVTLRVIDQVGIAPLTVRLKVRVPQDPRNRLLTLVMEGPYDGRTSEWTLDGERAAVTYDRQFDVRGGGPITFIAYVTRNDGRRPFAQATYCYTGTADGADCTPDLQ